MAISDINFKFCIWTGWLTGIIFLKKPWGPPLFTSWISLHTLWALIICINNQILLIDIWDQTRILSTENPNSLLKWLYNIILFVSYIGFMWVRLILMSEAKALSNLFHTMYFSRLYRQELKWKRFWQFATFLIIVSFLILLIISVMFGISLARLPLFPTSWFYNLGGTAFGIISGFGYFFIVSPPVVVFPLIILIISHLGMIFEDFCDDLEAHIDNRKLIGQQDNIHMFIVSKKSHKWQHSMDDWKRSDNFLKRLEKIESLFAVAARIVSPLALCLISVAGFRMVTDIFSIMKRDVTDIFGIVGDGLDVLEQSVHLGLVFFAQYIEDVIEDRKTRLRKLLTLSDGKNYETKVAELTILLKWKISACGLFDVNRGLLSGIMATGMTYVIILVQLQIAFDPKPNKNAVKLDLSPQ